MSMDTRLLQSWLELPPGPWPPPPSDLLGLPILADAAEAERRALKLMSRLRPHQLIHPELVTEGMNRLAQAMLSYARTTAVVVANILPMTLPLDPVVSLDLPASHSVVPVPEVEPALVLDAEIVEMQRAPDIQARFLLHANQDVKRQAAPSATVVIPKLEARNEPYGPMPSDRRLAYRALRTLCRLEAAWEALGPFAGAPQEATTTPGRIFALCEAHEAFLVAWKASDVHALELRVVAAITIAMFEQPTAGTILRTLTADQRFHLATDWAAGRAELAAERSAYRIALGRRGHRGMLPHPATRVLQFVSIGPEWIALAAGLSILLLTWLRS